MTSFGTATVKIPAAFAARTPCGESSKATASSARPEQAERLEIERGRRLCARGVAVGGADRVPADRLLEPLEMEVDPAARRARDDRALQPVTARGGEIVDDAGPHLLRLDQRELVRVAAVVERDAVERLADELLEVAHRAPRRVRRADERRPQILRQLVAVLAVEHLPAGARVDLRVEDQTVEVEEEGADCHGDAE